MPTAQSTSVQAQKSKNDNKIAKAVAKVEQAVTGNQEQPQSSGTTGNKTPQEQPEFIKQSLIIIEKKVRNLEKRRAKLDEYKASKIPLNEDQLLAVSKYEEVVRSMELARELEKQFIALANDALKQQKKQAKKDQMEREEVVRDRLREAHKISSLLGTFGDETVRNDFLNETNGATKLSQQELTMLDEFNKLVEPTELGNKLDASASETAEHMLYVIEGRNKPVTSFNTEVTGQVTYNELKKLFERILASSYWTRETQKVEQVEEQVVEQTPVESEQNLTESVNNMNLNEEQVEPQQQQHQQQVYQQNTSDSDYVLVNSNDYHPDNTQQQQQSKAYFTTLNPSTNINEFLQNNNEGINFLQDSEIQLQQQESQQQPQQVQAQQQPQQVQAQQQSNQGGFQEVKENRGGRGGHREYNGNRNYDQRRNYDRDQRRSGGGNYQPREQRGDNNGPREQRSDNNGPRNGSGGYRGGRGGYRGGYSNTGPRSGSGGNQYPRQPRDHQQQQQPVAQH